MAPTRRVKVVVNPSARSGRGRKALSRLARTPEGLDLEWVESRSAEHLRELVRSAQEESLDALAVGGGDGTVALALGALEGLNRVPLGVLPIGSGNDFARDLGISRSLQEALGVLAHGRAIPVDVGRAVEGGARFCCVASVGLDELALRIIHSSWLPRSKALNVWAALRALCVYRPREVRVTWRGGDFEGEVMFVAVTNTRGYGGGFLVSPAARLDDGLLDLCIVKRTGRARLLWHFPRILRGTHGGLPEVIQAASPWVRIESPGAPLPVALDGELPRLTTPVELRCDPGLLRVLAPVPVPSRRLQPCLA
jgi:diacylglycerol kinase (ATP)